MKSSIIYLCCALIIVNPLLISCGGSGGGGEEKPQISDNSIKGNVAAPAGVSLNTLTVNGALNDVPVSSNGNFKITLNPGVVQLLTARLDNGDPLFFNICIDTNNSSSISLDAKSTAKSLIFLSPFLATTDTELARLILNFIDSLPETSTLTQLLTEKLKVDPHVLVKGDTDIKILITTAQNNVLQHFLNGPPQPLSSQYPSAVIPSTEVSGLKLYDDCVGNECSFYITNRFKRWVWVYEMVEGLTGYEYTSNSYSDKTSIIAPIPGLLDGFVKWVKSEGGPLSPEESDTIKKVINGQSVKYRAFGLGFNGIDQIENEPEFNRWIYPALYTAILEFVIPIVSIISGIRAPVSFVGAPHHTPWISLINEMIADPDFYSIATSYYLQKDMIGLFIRTIIFAFEECLQEPKILIDFLRYFGLNILVAAAKVAVLPLRAISLVDNSLSVGLAIGSFARAENLVDFTLTAYSPDLTPPTTPANLTALPVAYNRIELTWSQSLDDVGIQGYKIYRDSTYLTSSRTNSFSDLGLSALTNYCYQVSGYDAANNESSNSSMACATTLARCTDNDSDGYFSSDGCGTLVDCNDNVSNIYPGATEICGDGIDQDSNGVDLVCQGGQILFSDDFQDGNANGWTVYYSDGPWSVIAEPGVPGNYVYWGNGSPSATGLGRSLSSYNPGTSDYSIQADVKIVKGDTGTYHGIEGRGTSPENIYYFTIHAASSVNNASWFLARLTGARTSIMVATGEDATIVANKWYQLKMEFNGNAISCFIRDKEQDGPWITVVNAIQDNTGLTPLQGTLFGLHTHGGGTYFDNVIVSELP